MKNWTDKYEYPSIAETAGFKTAGELQAFLEERYQLQGHPKAAKLFRLAWEEGHASGMHEVVMYYIDFADLIEPAIEDLLEACRAAQATLEFWGKMGVNVNSTWEAPSKLRKAITKYESEK